MNIITIPDAAAKLGITQQAFRQSVLPVMLERGDADPVAERYAIEGDIFWQWEVYATTRRNLIAAGEWASNRPWSVEDLEDIVLNDMYEEYNGRIMSKHTLKQYKLIPKKNQEKKAALYGIKQEDGSYLCLLTEKESQRARRLGKLEPI